LGVSREIFGSAEAIGFRRFPRVRATATARVLRLVTLEPIDCSFLGRIRWAIVWFLQGGDRSGVCCEVSRWLAPAKTIAISEAEAQTVSIGISGAGDTIVFLPLAGGWGDRVPAGLTLGLKNPMVIPICTRLNFVRGRSRHRKLFHPIREVLVF
jgi:hypothetical protein